MAIVAAFSGEREEGQAAPPVAEAAAWPSNEATSPDGFSHMDDYAEL